MEKYFYCDVEISGVFGSFYYINDCGSLPEGTHVLVPFGADNTEAVGTVLDCREYEKNLVPYPVNNTKRIIRVISEEEFFANENIQEDLDMVDGYIEDGYWDDAMEWAVNNHMSQNPRIIEKLLICYRLALEHTGNPLAALNLGTMYYTGRGVEQDYSEAFRLYEIAANDCVAQGVCNCGYIFYYGRIGQVDYEKAYQYFSTGALVFNDENCMYKLGDMYLNGYYVKKNEHYAYRMYENAYQQVEKYPEYNTSPVKADIELRLGKCRLFGIGTEKLPEVAITNLSQALTGFCSRRKTDPFAPGLISEAKALLCKAMEAVVSGQ